MGVISKSVFSTSERFESKQVRGNHRTIGARDDNVKVSTILALVGGRFGREARSPEGALDVGKAGRVGAVRVRADGRVPLEVDVEAATVLDRVALRRALCNVVGVKRVETHVAVGAGRTLLVDKRPRVSSWRRGTGGLLLTISRQRPS